MRKSFSLDFTIVRDTDRMEHVRKQLAAHPSPSSISSKDLELMVTYIMYGKDEEGRTALQRKEMIHPDRRYKSFQRKDEKSLSLDALQENPLFDEKRCHPFDSKERYTDPRPTIRRPRYAPDGTLIDIGDADIPGMRELWEDIDQLEHKIAVYQNEVPAGANDRTNTTEYQLYILRHSLIDIRRHQYYLKQSYKPPIEFTRKIPPSRQFIDWSSDSVYNITVVQLTDKLENTYDPYYSKNIEDYEDSGSPTGYRWTVNRHTFDWENPTHVRALLHNYSAIHQQLWDELNSWGLTLIWDFDRYSTLANLSPVRTFILTRAIDGASNTTIAAELQEKYGFTYNINYIGRIINTEIPQTIADKARANRLLAETPSSQRQKCASCGRFLPLDTLFYTRNNTRLCGFGARCKSCERQSRVRLGITTQHSQLLKDATVPTSLKDTQEIK